MINQPQMWVLLSAETRQLEQLPTSVLSMSIVDWRSGDWRGRQCEEESKRVSDDRWSSWQNLNFQHIVWYKLYLFFKF